MIKAILFDLDNTLVDFMKIKMACVEVAVSAMINSGLKMKKEEAIKALYEVYWDIGIEHANIFQLFLEKINGFVDYKILSAAIVAYRKMQYGLQDTYPGVIKTLIKLRENGLKLAIVSDAPKLKAWIRLTELKLENFFDSIITFEDTGEKKPSELPFKKALKELNLSPEEVLMIGDFPERDIIGAKNLGIKTCFAKYGWAFQTSIPENSGADYSINNIEELISLLRLDQKF